MRSQTRVHYGLNKKELRALSIDELQKEYDKWNDEYKSFRGSNQAQLICTRILNRIKSVYDEKK